MFTNVAFNAHRTFSGVAAAIVVAFGVATLDQGHLIGAPAGVVEIGEPVAADQAATVAMLPEITVTASRLVEVAQLPEVTVRAKRLSDAPEAVASVAELPEVVVLGKRVAMMVADAAQPSKGSSTVGALLK
jgi:hypothetical protein